MLMKNLLKATADNPAVEMPNDYVGNCYSTLVQPAETLTVSSNETIIQSLDNITSMLISSPQIQAPPSVENTTLNDDQINEIMSYLLELQEKYFYDIPLSKDLCKQFVWNIPIPIYKRFAHCREYELCDLANPIMLFYIFCTDDPMCEYDDFMAIIHELALHDESTNSYLDNELLCAYGSNADECDRELFEESFEETEIMTSRVSQNILSAKQLLRANAEKVEYSESFEETEEKGSE